MTGKHVVCIGAGLIGSFTLPLLVRDRRITKITIVDPDTYDEGTVACQNIDLRSVGFHKCHAQAAILKCIRPDIEVVCFADYVERVPLGALRCDVICVCVDTKLARMSASEIAFRLGGIPIVDSGVLGSQLLARVTVYPSSSDGPCVECAFGDDDYRNLEVPFACQPNSAIAPPTNSPSFLGALAAAHQAAECSRILDGNSSDATIARELIIGADSNVHLVTQIRRNQSCRFDHLCWHIEDTGGPRSSSAPADMLSRPASTLSVFKGCFCVRRNCRACRHAAPTLRFMRWGEDASAVCDVCGGTSEPLPFDWEERLTFENLLPAMQQRTLKSIGVQTGDVVTLTSADGERHYIVGN